MRYLIVTFVTALVAYTVQAEPPLYSVSSKAHGTQFDLVVTEIQREPNKSYLSVPGFHKRPAQGSRWLMCAYTDLAIKRGFSYWSVMYPTPDNETLVVAFTNSSEALPKDLFDAEFDKDRNIGVGQVDKFVVICGMKR